MNLYHLRYFVTLAHLEHYTKAADVLAITQPSLSHAISSLEEELGVKLFEKNGRNVSLTKYGKSFLEDVEQTLNRLDSSVNGLQLAGKGEGQIDVAFLRTLGVDFMPKIIRICIRCNVEISKLTGIFIIALILIQATCLFHSCIVVCMGKQLFFIFIISLQFSSHSCLYWSSRITGHSS